MPMPATTENDPDGFIRRGKELAKVREDTEDEVEARELLTERGFTQFELTYRPAQPREWMRWYCLVTQGWAPIFGGKAKGWGKNPREAVLNALGCQPRLHD